MVLVGGLVGVDRSVAVDTAAGGGVVGLGGFSDVGGGVHRAGVDALEAEGVFEGTGCGEGLFCPDDPIHRWVMAVWMIRVLDGGDPAGSGSSRFADVDAGMWWASYVERLAELEVTAGCATGPLRFCPDDPVTRGQMATFVARALGLVEVPDPPPDDPSPVAGGFVAIDGRGYTSCGLRADGMIECLGRRPPEGAFIDLSMGSTLSCGVRADGTVACWGADFSGEADPPEGRFVTVAASFPVSCGIRVDGTIACWGSNQHGDPPEGRFATLAAGGQVSCGIRVGGGVECWGREGPARPVLDVPEEPLTVATASDSAWWGHGCGLRPDGSVVCWGANGHGETDPPEGRFVDVATGSNFSCGVRAGGTMECWGYGRAVDPPGGQFTSVSLGRQYGCGVRVDGTVEC